MSFIVQSPEAMIALGREMASACTAGSVLALCGDLGAGKTHLSKGLVEGVGGCADDVTSPTFTLVQEYRGQSQRLPVVHFDFYRMERAEEVIRLGWEEYIDENQGILLVEWADKFPELMPEETEWWSITIDGNTRSIERKT